MSTQEYNSDISKNILTKAKLDGLYFALRNAKKDHEDIEGQWAVIGKYHERLWFQKSYQMTLQELLNEYKRLAEILIRLENAMNEYKTLIHFHNVAQEELSKSMTPYKGIDLKQHTLNQQELF